MTLPGDEQAFLCCALAQLAPDARPVFTARLGEYLRAIADPGVGDVDRALRHAWTGLWVPPAFEHNHVSRWDRDDPRYGRVSRAAKLPPELPPDCVGRGGSGGRGGG